MRTSVPLYGSNNLKSTFTKSLNDTGKAIDTISAKSFKWCDRTPLIKMVQY